MGQNEHNISMKQPGLVNLNIFQLLNQGCGSENFILDADTGKILKVQFENFFLNKNLNFQVWN